MRMDPSRPAFLPPPLPVEQGGSAGVGELLYMGEAMMVQVHFKVIF